MSDLKDLTFAVQQQVDPTDFDQIVRRGRRRRNRNRLLISAGTAVTTAAVVATPLIGLRGLEQPNPAPVPATAPTQPAVPAGAELREFTMMAGANRWSASWMTCPPEPCRHVAKVSRGQTSAITGMHPRHITTLSWIDLAGLSWPDVAAAHDPAEPVAVIAPEAVPLTATDPTWARTELLRLPASGPVRSKLRYAAPTTAIGPGDIVSDDLVAGELSVLDVGRSTLRVLKLPTDLAGGRSPVRDNTGRWWIVAGSGPSWVAWTDDLGQNWARAELDAEHAGGTVAVSPNGRTVVATSWRDGATLEPIGTIRMSTDAGQTWRTVSGGPWARTGGPVAYDDGTAVLLGQGPDDRHSSAYRIDRDGKISKLTGFPKLQTLDGRGDLLYGQLDQNTVIVSTDRGRSWKSFDPR